MYWSSIMSYAVHFGGEDKMLQNQKLFLLLLENMQKGR